MITEKEYLKAINTIKQYRSQIENQLNEIIDIDYDKTKLIEGGKKIKLTKAPGNSISNVGDVFEVVESYYNHYYKKYPIVVFINKNGNKSRISKLKSRWDYDVI